MRVTPGPSFKRSLKKLSKADNALLLAEIAALNKAGKHLKRDAVAIIRQDLVPTAAVNLKAKSRAASTRRGGDPDYRVTFGRTVPVSKLRASARQFRPKKKGGDVGKLTLKLGRGRDLEFQAVKRTPTGKGFGLAEAGPLPERGLGPVSYTRAFRQSPALKRRLEQAEREALAGIAAELEKAFR